MSMFKGKKKNYLLVIHEWWMGHKDWSHEFLIGVSEKEARAKGALIEKERSGDFINCTTTVIEIPETYMVHIEKAG